MDYDQELTPANVFVVPGKEEIESLLLEKRKAVRDSLPIFLMSTRLIHVLQELLSRYAA